MYTCGGFMLLYGRNQQNIVKHFLIKNKLKIWKKYLKLKKNVEANRKSSV